MAVIPTPNLAQMADPYADDVFNNMWRSAYGFKDTVRQDYLKDRHVPAKELGADLDYLNNRYALDSAQGTYGARLGSDIYGAQMGYQNAMDNYALYPELRGLHDQQAVFDAAGSMLDAQQNVGTRQAEIERRAAMADVNQRVASAVGNASYERAINAYTTALDDAAATPQVRQMLQQGMMQELQRALAVYPVGTPEHTRLRQLLITYGGYGVRQSPQQRQGFNAPTPTPPSATEMVSPYGITPDLSYGSYR